MLLWREGQQDYCVCLNKQGVRFDCECFVNDFDMQIYIVITNISKHYFAQLDAFGHLELNACKVWRG